VLASPLPVPQWLGAASTQLGQAGEKRCPHRVLPETLSTLEASVSIKPCCHVNPLRRGMKGTHIVTPMTQRMPAAMPRNEVVYVNVWNPPTNTKGHTGAEDPRNQEDLIVAYPRVDLPLPQVIAYHNELSPAEETDMDIAFEPYLRARGRVRRLRPLRRTR
jgi:hypothetical protein